LQKVLQPVDVAEAIAAANVSHHDRFSACVDKRVLAAKEVPNPSHRHDPIQDGKQEPPNELFGHAGPGRQAKVGDGNSQLPVAQEQVEGLVGAGADQQGRFCHRRGQTNQLDQRCAQGGDPSIASPQGRPHQINGAANWQSRSRIRGCPYSFGFSGLDDHRKLGKRFYPKIA